MELALEIPVDWWSDDLSRHKQAQTLKQLEETYVLVSCRYSFLKVSCFLRIQMREENHLLQASRPYQPLRL